MGRISDRARDAYTTRLANVTEDRRGQAMHRALPWLLWLLGTPFTASVFQGVCWLLPERKTVIVVALSIAAAAITWAVKKRDATRSKVGRRLNVYSTAVATIWVVLAVTYGWGGGNFLVLISWMVGGLVLCVLHAIWGARHADNEPIDVHNITAVGRARIVDPHALVRVVAQRAPVVRQVAETAGTVFPVLAQPWQQPVAALPAGSGNTAIDAAMPVIDVADQAEADLKWEAIRRNWRDYVTRKNLALNGAKLVALDVKPWRIKSVVHLVKGVQTPEMVDNSKGTLASQNSMGVSDIQVSGNPRNNNQAFVNWVLQHTLDQVVPWSGPTHIGASIADAPTAIGTYEDRLRAFVLECAVSEVQAAKLRAAGFNITEKNLTHTLLEGMTGSGKSNVARITITDGATRIDVVEWVIDTVKKFQTMGRLGNAIDWFATQVAEARVLVRFVLDVIAERANYLGIIGLDNWEPGCGLPMLRITIEEGGIVANELDNLQGVLNSARSAGVVIRLSMQRAHSGLVDTNVRAAFGSTMSFGTKTMEDLFAMAEDLVAMGCDPSQWADKAPGMLYWDTPGLDMERRSTALRTDKFDIAMGEQIVNEHYQVRDQWIRQNCQPWFEILERVDRNGVYAKRQTGRAVYEKIVAAARTRPAVGTTSTPALPPAVPPQRPAPLPEDEYETGVVGAQSDRGSYDSGDSGDLSTGWETAREEVTDMRNDNEQYQPRGPVTMADLMDIEADMDPELADAARADLSRGVDPGTPLAPMPGEESFRFPPREPDEPKMPKEQALNLVRRFLASKGAYWTFKPKDIYEPICSSTGLGTSWVRGVALATLVAEGVLEHNAIEQQYRVTDRLVEAVRQMPVGV